MKESFWKRVGKQEWLVRLLLEYPDGLTLKEINDRWQHTDWFSGTELSRKTFFDLRTDVYDLLGLIIDQTGYKGGYRYTIINPTELESKLGHKLMIMLGESGILTDMKDIQDRILLETAPGGEKWLRPIASALRHNAVVRLSYKPFEKQHTRTYNIRPLLLVEKERRWYLHGFFGETGTRKVNWALDRIVGFDEQQTRFDFVGQEDLKRYFRNRFGIFASDDEDVMEVVYRVRGKLRDLLLTLPLHETQELVEEDNDTLTFRIFVRPAYDLNKRLLSETDELEVLQPLSLRNQIIGILQKRLKCYGC